MNANPNFGPTPYIDFKERTGSDIYDYRLRTRIGDLSGLPDSALGDSVGITKTPGFGLAAENVFLSGQIKASSGSIGGIKMENNKLFNGTGTHGNANTPFFIDSASNFSLGSKFVWDGSDLTIEGSITMTTALKRQISGSSTAQATGAAASASAADTKAAARAVGASSSASLADAKAAFRAAGATASASAADAKAALRALGASASSSAVSSSAGLSLQSQLGTILANSSSISSYATPGVRVAARVVVDADSVDIQETDGTSIADYGANVRIGRAGEARTEISDVNIDMYDGAATPIKRVNINASGICSFGGDTSTDVSNTSQIDCVRIQPGTGVFVFQNAADFVKVHSGGVDVHAGDANNTAASFGSTTTIGPTATEHVKLTASSMEFKDGSTVLASYGGTTTIGVTSGNHVSITSTTLKLKNGSTEIISLAEGEVTVSGSILERTRLFGSGIDATISISQNSNSGTTYSEFGYGVKSAAGSRIMLNGPEHGGSRNADTDWHMTADVYCQDLTIASPVILYTDGFRLFVKDTLTIDSGAKIANDANGTTPGEGGTLSAGTTGLSGGSGGNAGGGQDGGNGGTGGGSGGFVFISARTIVNNGTIQSKGGTGGTGEDTGA
jgi:hypothetical protein